MDKMLFRLNTIMLTNILNPTKNNSGKNDNNNSLAFYKDRNEKNSNANILAPLYKHLKDRLSTVFNNNQRF